FFQAEDGIRDLTVTGVQTCALPIFGVGRLREPEEIVAECERILALRDDLAGLRVLVTAGGTREPIDAVRVITNRSSGKQGHAIRSEERRVGKECRARMAQGQ